MYPKFAVFFTVILMVGLYNVAGANAEGGTKHSGWLTVNRIPYPPPLPEYLCPRIAAVVKVNDHCYTDLKNKYLQTEGQDNRGLNFYYYASEFFSAHSYGTDSIHQTGYSVDVRGMVEALGLPDYQKSLRGNNEAMELYAYLFDYMGIKDYMMIVYSYNGTIYRIGYTQTAMGIDQNWSLYKNIAP